MHIPLAEQLRPKTIDDFIGQEHLTGKGKPVRRMIETGNISSMVFWGPPGCGKTTLAGLLARSGNANFVFFSAVTSGVEEVRKVIKKAKELRSTIPGTRQHPAKQQTILFVDEIHRFNKSQQDAFLPHVEDGTIILIGATTENPGFRVNAPLISRSQVYKFYPLTDNDIEKIVHKAILLYPKHTWQQEALQHIVQHANGDARTAINAVELASSLSKKFKRFGQGRVETVVKPHL